MMTLDSIRNVEFNRGRGYRAEEVDDFIDACAETVEALLRENEELNQKMKVLADKIVEYRNDEDSIRAALLNAQRAGDAARREAEEQAATLRAAAEADAENIRTVALAKIESEKKELERVQREVAAFKARMLALYKEHLNLIGLLPEEEAKPEPVAEPVAEEPAPEPVAPVVEPADDTVTPAAAEPDEGMKAVSRFDGLKFGNDYDIRNDKDEDEEKPSRGFLKKRK